MPDLRFDETTGDWVVFAPSRNRRPHHAPALPMTTAGTSTSTSNCPFCPGNERLTPPEIYAERPNDGDWSVRVVPNKFPALRIEEADRRQSDQFGFQSMGGCGAHEVIIESPNHSVLLSDQPEGQIERVLHAAQVRYLDLMQDHRFQSVIIFKNHGERAGTSLEHPHWQLIATPVVPHQLRLKHDEAAQFFDRTGCCLYCVIADRELAARERIILQSDHFVAICPYASRSPFETWILPRRHQSSFGAAQPYELTALAQTLKIMLSSLCKVLENPDFNLAIDTAPRGDEDKEYFLWHIRIVPRLSTPAGFEMGSGMSINTVLPEEASKFLRDASTSE